MMIKIATVFSSESVPLDGVGGSSTSLDNEPDISESTSEDSKLRENVHQTAVESNIAKPES